jgi:hypothetical protein
MQSGQESLRMIFSHIFHSVMNFGIIFLGNSPHNIHIFRPQKERVAFEVSTAMAPF